MLGQKKLNLKNIYTLILMALMYVVIALSIVELGWSLWNDIVSPPRFILEISELQDLLGIFLLILIAIELLDTLDAYLNEHVVHTEVVIEVGLVAIARKVILLDTAKLSGAAILGIAATILALAAGYYLLRRSQRPKEIQ